MAEAPALMQVILEAARNMGARVEEAAPELVGFRFNAEVLSDAIRGSSITRGEHDLPNKVGSARIDDMPLLVGELGGTPTGAQVDAQLRRYRNQAMIARSWLGAEGPNLQLFLIGPPGALIDRDWRELAAMIEADDKTCRKLVWLFDGAPGVDAARDFLAGTFVARPWLNVDDRVQLDSVATYTLPPGWEEAADDPDLDYDGLAARLIALESAQ